MTNSMAMYHPNLKTKTLMTVAAAILAVALPQLFHIVGVAAGFGSTLGAAFLPMQLPVFLAGLLAGPVAGLISGMVSPLISFALSGMPLATLLPNIMAELAVYGLVAGLLWNAKLPVIVKLLIAQIAGHAAKALVILISFYAMKSQAVPVSLIWSSITTGLPGILLQWSLIPLIVFWVRNRNSSHD